MINDTTDLISSLKVALGSAFVLYVKVHGMHWNVEGIHFHDLHAFFGELYQENWLALDTLAEQIRQLDAYAPSSPERLIELSQIASFNEPLSGRDMVLTLLTDQEIMIGLLTTAFHLAEAADKQGLADFLAERISAHSKQRWQLRVSGKKLRE